MAIIYKFQLHHLFLCLLRFAIISRLISKLIFLDSVHKLVDMLLCSLLCCFDPGLTIPSSLLAVGTTECDNKAGQGLVRVVLTDEFL